MGCTTWFITSMKKLQLIGPRIINADINPQSYYLPGEGSSLANRGTINVSKKLESRTDEVVPNASVVRISKVHTEEDNAERLPNRLITNEPETRADETEHFKQFEKMLNFVAMWGAIAGLQLDYKWKRNNPRYVFLSLMMVYTWINILYSQYVHVKSGDFSGLLEVFSLYGIGFAVILTNVVNFRNYKEITALMHFTRKICLQNVNGARATTLKARLIKIYNVNIFFACSGLACICLYAGYPLLAFFVDGEFISIMPIEIMFVDKSTLSGFLLSNAIMSVMGVCTVLLLLFVNLSFFTSITNYSIQVDMIEEDIKELNEYWSDASIPFKGYQQMLLRNVCQKQQDMNNYINKIQEIYHVYIFFFFVFSYVSQIICMFEIIINNWISGYGIAFGLFLCHVGYCFMGTLINNENERFLNLLHQFEWYNWDMPSKKAYIQLLTTCMDFTELWIGPLAPLNLLTAINIVKSMYSYYTVLMEFA